MFIRFKREHQISHLSGELLNCEEGEDISVAGYLESVEDLSDTDVLLTICDSLGEMKLSINKENYIRYAKKNNIGLGSLLFAFGTYNDSRLLDNIDIHAYRIMIYRNEGI